MERLRITFSKTGALRYTSHLDLQMVWTRALLRAHMPLAYTQGFHPVPKVGYSWPLPLGWGTEGELIDIWLDGSEPVDGDRFIQEVNKATPVGLKVSAVEKIPYSAPALTNVIQSAEYIMTFPAEVSESELQSKMDDLFAQNEIIRERRGKTYDLKALTESWHCYTNDDGRACIATRMAARNAAMGRPDELAAALGYDPIAVDYIRVKYFL